MQRRGADTEGILGQYHVILATINDYYYPCGMNERTRYGRTRIPYEKRRMRYAYGIRHNY